MTLQLLHSQPLKNDVWFKLNVDERFVCRLGPAKERIYRAPTIGDKVICHHFKWAYYPATIVAFDRAKFEYTVDWDDGDPSGRQESYKNVALNSVPRSDEIAVGTIVFFPQVWA